jgi:hypothetical protein
MGLSGTAVRLVPERALRNRAFCLRVALPTDRRPAESQAMSMAWRRAGASLLSCPPNWSVSYASNPAHSSTPRRSFVIYDFGADCCTERGTNTLSTCGGAAVGGTVRASFLCSPTAVRSLAERSLGALLEGVAMTGKRELRRARSSSSGVGNGAVAGAVLRDVGSPEELTWPVSFPVPAGISKSGASPLAAVARTLPARPLSGRSHDPW